MRSENTTPHTSSITRAEREKLNQHKAAIIWITGLSGSGKSTLAYALEQRLYQMGCRTFVLDGDNMRQGLCGDLGFSEEDRKENIRRVGETAKLFYEAGLIVIAAFISPKKEERDRVRALVPAGDFIEVYCECPLEICEQRDPKGLYKKARLGKIKNFTGLSAPYEAPVLMEISINSVELNVSASVENLIEFLFPFGR
ncbi:MAG: adenylyl-sulfate kinase [Burkholderiaceae bacterium]|nr:adenylyl-sulfate kinase [Burkholderiaceae bacterium]